jgi:hypothetical protein
MTWFLQITRRVIANDLRPVERLAVLDIPFPVLRSHSARLAFVLLQEMIRNGLPLGMSAYRECTRHFSAARSRQLLRASMEVGSDDLEIVASTILEYSLPLPWVQSGKVVTMTPRNLFGEALA